MPEGHTIHRAAQDQRPMLIGQPIAMSSPQGRFAAGARLLDSAIATGIEPIGKHILYHFDNGRSLHLHLGLAGKIYRSPKPVPPPRDVVRVRMESATHVVDITGPAICEILGVAELKAFRLRYGPDLLAEVPDPARAIEKIHASRSPIGTLLMNQKVISGIGNIYRTEILWLLGIHPLTRGCDLGTDILIRMWQKLRDLMLIGVRYDSIITNGDLPKAGQGVGERVHIYGKEVCPKCTGPIVVSRLNNRTLYHCAACQTR
ncbi:MAG: Fpg/Nei family DNA glycosylase [Rhodobacteraceae bacterium]|nr:Fpg/Nei family DNA glycosylase [Paracoccaceae bacterium]